MADPSYRTYAMIGVNLNQASTGGSPNPYTPTVGSITFNVSNPGGSTVYVTLMAADSTTRWCYVLTSSNNSVTLPYSSFNTTCWDGKGTAYTGEPLTSLGLVVPPSATTATVFSMCLDALAI